MIRLVNIIKKNKNILISLTLKASGALAKLIIIGFILRSVGVESYGIYTIGMSVFLLGQVISRYGIDIKIQKMCVEGCNNKNELRNIFGFLILSSVISFFVMLVLSPFMYYYSNGIAYNIWIYFILSAPLYSFLWNGTYFLKGINKIELSILNIEILMPAVQILMFYLLYSILQFHSSVAASFFISVLICASLMMFYFVFILKIKPKINIENFYIELKDSRSYFIILLSSTLLVWSDTYLLSIMMTPEDVGYYNVITKIGMVILLPASVFTVYANNMAVKYYKNLIDINMIKNKMTFNTIFLLLIVLSIVFGVFVFFQDLCSLLKISYNDDIFIVVILYVVAQVILAIMGPFETFVMMSKTKEKMIKINISMAIINAFLCWIFIPKFGLAGASLSTLISVILSKAYMLKIVKDNLRNSREGY